MRLRILSLAEDDLLKGFQFYRRQGPHVGNYFMETLCADIELLRLHAGIHRRIFNYHRALSTRFPFAIYYDINEQEIRIWRVLDCRRNPRWIKRQLLEGR